MFAWQKYEGRQKSPVDNKSCLRHWGVKWGSFVIDLISFVRAWNYFCFVLYFLLCLSSYTISWFCHHFISRILSIIEIQNSRSSSNIFVIVDQMGKEKWMFILKQVNLKSNGELLLQPLGLFFDIWTFLINEVEISELCKYSARQLLQVSFAKT